MSMMPSPFELKFHVTKEEREIIEKKMEQVGTTCMASYLRKMALDGYIVKLDLPELSDLISLLRRSGNNINQIAKKANTINCVYESDIKEVLRLQEELWEAANKILNRIALI